ncbi:MAG: hypothetical protein ACM34H_10115, partial [Deltaproteobacteria bacterium]
ITATRVEGTVPISSDARSSDGTKEELTPPAVEPSNSMKENPAEGASHLPSPISFRMKAGLLLLYRENSDTPLVTDSFSPGGTNIVNAKDLDLKFEPGLDASLGAVLRTLGTTFGAEVRYFGIHEWSESHGPVLRPPDTLVVIKHQPEIAFFSTSETSVFAKYKSELYNVELNLSWYPGEQIRAFIGGRYMKLDEALRISTESFGTTYVDEVSTKNDLLGVQLGIEGVFFGRTDDGFSMEGWAKAGYFHNDISAKANFPLPVIGNLSARSSKNENTLAGEFGIGVSYAFFRNIALSARYQLLWLNHVALAPEQWPVTDYATGRINTATDSVIYHGAWVGVILSW